MTVRAGSTRGRAARLSLLLAGAVAVPGGLGAPDGLEGQQPGATGRDAPVDHGRADYGWRLRTLDGERVRLERYGGRVLVLNMWATWCPPCVAELASFQRLRDALAGTGVRLLLVSPEEPDVVAAFLRRHDYDLPVLVEDRRMPDAFGLRALPTTWIIDRDGRIVLKHRGAGQWDDPSVLRFLLHLADGDRAASPH